MYVIKNVDTGKYVALPGSRHSYTTAVAKMQMFATRERAQAECCGNEVVVELHAVGR